jgi:hypothetical protein
MALNRKHYYQSKWLLDSRYEMFSRAETMGLWARIPLKAWMSVCIYSVCVVLCVGSGLATGWSPGQGVLSSVCKIHISWFINSECVQATEPKLWREKRRKLCVNFFHWYVWRYKADSGWKCQGTLESHNSCWYSCMSRLPTALCFSERRV